MELDIVYVVLEGIILKNGIMMIKVNNNDNLSIYFEVVIMVDVL